MAPHSSTLAWKIPWMEEPERLQSMGSLSPILAPHLEKMHKTPPSSRYEGLLFLHGLESSPKSSLQTSQEA